MLLKYKYFIALALATLAAAWWAWGPKPPKQEVYAPPVQQVDGSVVLEKKPMADAKPVHKLPAGAKLERKVTVTVQAKVPTATVSGSVTIESVAQQAKAMLEKPEMVMQAADPALECPPVTVDLSLVEMPDSSRRVIASSPDGSILGGVDIPVKDAPPPPEPKLWAVGAAISTRQNLGVWIERDLGFLRLGAEANTTGNESGVRGVELWGKVGIRF